MARAFTLPVSLPASGTVRRVPKNSRPASHSRRQYLLGRNLERFPIRCTALTSVSCGGWALARYKCHTCE
jgi:hypothetical protein